MGVLTHEQFEALPLEEKRKIEHSRVCPFCGGAIGTIAHGEDSWETICYGCDYLFDED